MVRRFSNPAMRSIGVIMKSISGFCEMVVPRCGTFLSTTRTIWGGQPAVLDVICLNLCNLRVFSFRGFGPTLAWPVNEVRNFIPVVVHSIRRVRY
jgi:hypothetical protein